MGDVKDADGGFGKPMNGHLVFGWSGGHQNIIDSLIGTRIGEPDRVEQADIHLPCLGLKFDLVEAVEEPGTR